MWRFGKSSQHIYWWMGPILFSALQTTIFNWSFSYLAHKLALIEVMNICPWCFNVAVFLGFTNAHWQVFLSPDSLLFCSPHHFVDLIHFGTAAEASRGINSLYYGVFLFTYRILGHFEILQQLTPSRISTRSLDQACRGLPSSGWYFWYLTYYIYKQARYHHRFSISVTS